MSEINRVPFAPDSQFTISQSDLREYQRLDALAKKFEEQRQQLRRNLLHRVRDGGCVERGALSLFQADLGIVRFSRSAILRNCGKVFVEQIERMLRPSRSRCLWVEDTAARCSTPTRVLASDID